MGRQSDPTAEVQEHSFVQRLLIFFPDLPKMCEASINESSTFDELAEKILYFHCGSSFNFDDSDSCEYATEDAVQFMGLCEALYTFPSAFSNNENDGQDRSREIEFDKSTIIFCSLEKDEQILAVIQVSQGNPLAIRTSIQRSHEIFCLLRGGGILTRLQSKLHLQNARPNKLHDCVSHNDLSVRSLQGDDGMPPDMSDIIGFEPEFLQQPIAKSPSVASGEDDPCFEDDGCTFSGMKSLYQLRQKIRKMKHTLSKLSSFLELKRKAIEQELEDTTRKLKQLLSLLPITSLRKELKAHYNEYLLQGSLSNRCVVEMVPRPMDTSASSTIPSALATDHIHRTIHSLLKQSLKSDSMDGPYLFGISTFYAGNLLFTQSLLDLDKESTGKGISNQNASHILRYMTYFEQRMQLQPSKRLPLRLMMRGAPLAMLQQSIQDSLQQLNRTQIKTALDKEQLAFGNYLSSPPLSMLNIADELSEVTDGVLGNVWTPVFYLSLDGQHFPAQVALYSLQGYTFLVYLEAGELDVTPASFQLSTNSIYDDYFSDISSQPMWTSATSADKEEQLPVAKLLTKVSIYISVCINDASTGTDDSQLPEIMSREKGVDIVFVDRENDDVVILLNKAERKGIFEKVVRRLSKDRDDNDDGLLASDLRHQFLTRLLPDAVEAVDDMMNEIHNSGTVDVELCTYFHHGWIWGASCGDRELYIVFDSTEHSTINDVHQTAKRIRQYFFLDRTKFE